MQSKIYSGFGSNAASETPITRGTIATPPPAGKFIWLVRGVQAPPNGWVDIRSICVSAIHSALAPEPMIFGTVSAMRLDAATPGKIADSWDDAFGEPITRPDAFGRVATMLSQYVQGRATRNVFTFQPAELRAVNNAILFVATGYYFEDSATGYAIDTTPKLAVNGVYGFDNDNLNIKLR